MHPGVITIIPYQEENLAELLHNANKKQTPVDYIKSKYHFDYIKEFLSASGLQGKFIVEEIGYISKDYLSDYIAYYSSCFENYAKTCTRLHLFTYEIDKAKSQTEIFESFKQNFEKAITEGTDYGENRKFWDKNYLGYIVIKPIPSNFIGFTLLRDYNYNPDRPSYKQERSFWGVRKYTPHIFGNEIEMDSLAFQEQDSNVSACATIAIWTMLQRAAEDYHVILKSPSQITLDTGLTNFDGNRLMPNDGLTPVFMAQAIAKNNLVTEVRGADNFGNFNQYLKKLIYAYSPLKIPIILGILVPDNQGDMAGHAVTICGHNMLPPKMLKKKNACLRMVSNSIPESPVIYNAERINKVYAHDDQWGPFARFEFVGNNQLQSSWSKHTKIDLLAEPKVAIVSTYPKVRISYDRIEKIVEGLDKIWTDGMRDKLVGDIVWDIRLFLSEDFKKQVQQADYFDKNNKTDRAVQFYLLTKNFPKYVWIATLMVQYEENQNVASEPVIYFVFDATGLTHSSLIHTVLCLYPALGDAFLNYLYQNRLNNSDGFQSLFSHAIEKYIAELAEIQKLYSLAHD